MKRLNPFTNLPFKRGDLDNKKNIFFCYQKNIITKDGFFGERWITKDEIKLKKFNQERGYKKVCTKCKKKILAKNNFYIKISTKDGYEAWCKKCVLKKNQNWFDNNKDHHHELTSKWYEDNKNKHLKTSRKNYQKNPKRKLVDYYRRQERTARATPKWVKKSDFLKIYNEAEKRTKITGIPHEVDHIIPLVHKNICGLNVPSNLQILTRTQNRKKANKWKL